MSDPLRAMSGAGATLARSFWTHWLVIYVRVLAALWMAKGLFHWAQVGGFLPRGAWSFETAPLAWQAATIFFAVLDLVAAVGLWLAAAWGGVVWLTSALSLAAIELLFPDIYGGRILVAAVALLAVAAYLVLTLLAAREHAANEP